VTHSKSSEMGTDLAREAVAEISDELLLLLSDAFSPFLVGHSEDLIGLFIEH